MKYQVTLWVSGRNYTDVVYANSPRDARDAAQARNPEAKVVAVNVSFK